MSARRLAAPGLMALLLAGGWWYLKPQAAVLPELGLAFRDVAAESGCLNVHQPCRLSDKFDHLMPWLSAVGAAAAAADFDQDGWTDLYVLNSARGAPNRLFRNLGDGRFLDVAAQAGIALGNQEGACMDAVFGDLDNDGDQDLYVVRWGAPNLLFANRGDGTFVDRTAEAGVGFWGYPNAVVAFDYDRDGLLDLYVGNYFSETVEDPATGERVRNDLWNPVTTRVLHETFINAQNGGRNVLYRNLGGGRFADVTVDCGLLQTGWTLDVGAGDLNNDGWPDLYVANDYGADGLYLSTGAEEDPPRFVRSDDPGGHPGIGRDWWKGMNVDMADVDGNGLLDIYVSNILVPKQMAEGNMLWLGYPDPDRPGRIRYENHASGTGTIDGGWGWGAKFGDFNNDGLVDIFAASGFISGADPRRNYWFALQELTSQHRDNITDTGNWRAVGDLDLAGHQADRLFMQTGRAGGPGPGAGGKRPLPRFVEMAARCGIADPRDGRGAALLDFDRDGDLDIYLANQNAPGCLYRNGLIEPGGPAAATGSRWLSLHLIGDPGLPVPASGRSLASSRDAVGARVEIWADRACRLFELGGANGFASQSESVIHCGLGDLAAVDSLAVGWPSGRREIVPGGRIALDARYTVREGQVLDSFSGGLF